MDVIRAFLSMFPLREFELRRLCARNERFRSICLDYEVAAKALAHWRKVLNEGAVEATQKVEDYTSLVTELEAEILTELNDRSLDT